jgi:hypothetical protein
MLYCLDNVCKVWLAYAMSDNGPRKPSLLSQGAFSNDDYVRMLYEKLTLAFWLHIHLTIRIVAHCKV